MSTVAAEVARTARTCAALVMSGDARDPAGPAPPYDYSSVTPAAPAGVGHCRGMEALWFVLAAVCVAAGLVLLWLDRRRRSGAPAPVPEPNPDEQPGALFRDDGPRR
ncbi:hypothetical protein GCM10017691_56050 [Pseudonocardia petroleophila]